MADQTRFRPQQRGPNSPQAPSGAESRFSRRGEDPLAELARLIGQDDPFAEFSNGQRPASRGPQQRIGSHSDLRDTRRDDRYGAHSDDDNRPLERVRKTEQAYAPRYEDEDGYDSGEIERPAGAPRANGRSAYSYGGARLDRDEPERTVSRGSRSPQQPAASRSQVRYDDDIYNDQDYQHDGVERNGYDDPRAVAVRVNDDRRRSDEVYDRDYSPDYTHDYAEHEYASENHEQGYVDTPRTGRRWLLVGVMALIGLVVVAVSGVYGYRALFGKLSASNPPTIRSADAPNKVVPQANPEGGGQKLIYDRAPGGGERVVSREEQPADLGQNRGGGRVTSPVSDSVQPVGQASAFAPPGQTGAAQVTPAMNNTNTATGEPKRVRTMTVRSDGSMVADAAPARPAPQTNAQRSSAPLALNPTTQAPDDDTADATANRQPARTASRNTAPAQNSQQPWAIVQQPAAPTPAPQQQASNYVPAGSYVVQVSSQKSEADAQTAWRQMQSRYTNVLGSQQATIKRVDLGDRGTFYRAMVGPFTTRDQAYEMCQNLKAAGGECVVQRN